MNPGLPEIMDVIMELAAREAASARYSEITSAHVLMALSKICESKQPSQPVVDELRREFNELGIEPRAFRRRLRAIVGTKASHPSDEVMHRSASCKVLFEYARVIADKDRMPVGLAHLVRAAFACFGDETAALGAGTVGPPDDVPAEL